MTIRIDLHQHVWTESLIDGLAAAVRAFVRRGDGLTMCTARASCRSLTRRPSRGRLAPLVGADRLDQALVAMSSPVGIEMLAAEWPTS